MKKIILFISTALLIGNVSFAQTENKKVERDTSKKEIIIKDAWSTSKETPEKKVTTTTTSTIIIDSNGKRHKKTRTYNNETTVGFGDTSLKIIEAQDTTIIGVGSHELVISDNSNNSNINLRNKNSKKRTKNFIGHWTGIELGIASFKESSDDFMELSYPKSAAFNINFLQYNVPLIGNSFGLVTGLGLSWYNFRFAQNVTMVDKELANGKHVTTQISIKDRYNTDEGIKKSKLTMSYLTVPLIFEQQFSKGKHFIAAGVIGGVKLGSHTKIKYSGGSKVKDYDDFYIQPFKADATVRLGIGFIKLWGTYSLIPLFEKDKLYDSTKNEFVTKTPYAIGIAVNIF